MLMLPSRLCSSPLRKKATQYELVRNMATLKSISIRLKSVKNIQKITQSMKMVSAAKFARAERDLKAARPIGEGSRKFYDLAEVGKKPEDDKSKAAEDKPNYLFIAVSSDRGLCGAIHSSVARKIRASLLEYGDKIKIVCIGDKSRSMIARTHAKNILLACNEVGRLPPTFLDASLIIKEIMSSEYEYDIGKIIYNRFRSVVSYATSEMPLFRIETVMEAPRKDIYDDADDDEMMLSYVEFSMASMLFYAMKEAACSEQSARMTAMDNASKNAGEMIGKLTLTFNRTRQAVITRELIEIISGASALQT